MTCRSHDHVVCRACGHYLCSIGGLSPICPSCGAATWLLLPRDWSVLAVLALEDYASCVVYNRALDRAIRVAHARVAAERLAWQQATPSKVM